MPFSRELFIERDDFMEEPPKKFFRLAPGREVRLRGTYFVTCERVVKNDAGEIVELRCTYDPATRGGNAPDGRKVKATIHWVSAAHAVTAEVRLYDRLFTSVTPGDEADGGDWRTSLNPASLEVLALPGRAGAGRGASRATGSSSSGSGTSAWIASRRRTAGVQPDRDAEGHVGPRVAADRRVRGRQRMRRSASRGPERR